MEVNVLRARWDERLYGIFWPISAVIYAVVSTIAIAFDRRRPDYEQSRALRLERNCEPAPAWASHLPFGLDLLVKAFQRARNRTVCQFFYEISEKSAPTHEQRLLGARGFGTSEPTNIEAILSKQFEDFDLGLRHAQFAPLLGDGIFTQSGASWKCSRNMLRPQFMSNRYQNFEEIKACVENLLEDIPASGLIDLQPLLFRLTSQTAMFVLFGGAASSLHSSSLDGRDVEFADAFSAGQEYLSYRSRVGELFWLINPPGFGRACRRVHAFVDEMVRLALDEARDTPSSPTAPKRYVFIDALIEQTHDKQALRDQCLNILLAGRDTTACCLTWTMRLLARHPRVLGKLRDEIAHQVGIGKNAAQPSRDDLKAMRYLGHVVTEALRLYPPVPVNARAAKCATTLPVGGGPDGKSPVLVRQGESVGYCTYAMHRRKDIYGEDALEFKPERWENDALKHVGYGYLPFNAGPRSCLGQEFALLEATYTVARLVQRFPFIALPDDEKVVGIGQEKQILTLVLLCEEGCRVVLRDTESRKEL